MTHCHVLKELIYCIKYIVCLVFKRRVAVPHIQFNASEHSREL